MSTAKLTQAKALEYLDYDPNLGTLTWIKASSPRAKVGSTAGSLVSSGHLQVKLFGELYQAHQLIWLMCYGYWPTNLVDHKDGVGINNSLINLREATFRENAFNRKLRCDSKAKLKGVSKKNLKWVARIWDGSKNLLLGSFSSPQEAAIAYDEAALKLQGAFAKTNKALGLI